MPSHFIVVQVGQCGNQIGSSFWKLAMKEHGLMRDSGESKKRLREPVTRGDSVLDDALATFFSYEDLASKTRARKPSNVKARAVLIDMEEGVVSQVLRSPIGFLFDDTQLITEVSGSGNNWAVGHLEYGGRFRGSIAKLLQKSAEKCDHLAGFLIVHSLGGGTGSGLGTAVLSILENQFPHVPRFVVAVYPSVNDDVIISPYNAVLAMRQLTEKADCVLPVHNQRAPGRFEVQCDESNVFYSSSRFPGSLNVDMGEICTNMVPFPRMHYLVPSLTPLHSQDLGQRPRVDDLFTRCLSRESQLVNVNLVQGLNMAVSFLGRGNICVADMRRNIERLQPRMKVPLWSTDVWKVGLCSVPPLDHPFSLLALSNNTAVEGAFSALASKFRKLYQRKAHVHHFLQVNGMEEDDFKSSFQSLDELILQYRKLERSCKNF